MSELKEPRRWTPPRNASVLAAGPIRGYEDLPETWAAGPGELEARIARAQELAATEAEKLAGLEQEGVN